MTRRSLALVLLALVVFSLPVFANAVQPPSLVIIVPGAPEGYTISLMNGTNDRSAKKSFLLEDQFALYNLPRGDEIELRLGLPGEEQTVVFDKPPGFSPIVTIEPSTLKVTQGYSLSRIALQLFLRVGLTLLIEGAIFWFYGFRRWRSWILFVFINLVTQGYLAYSINRQNPFLSYVTMGIFMLEVGILLVEWVFYRLTLRENRAKITEYVFTANIVSLALGLLILYQLGM